MTAALSFLGGAGTVTGSKTLVETPDARVLVDCGLFQGRKELRRQNWAPFPVAPESIDAVVLTHAHVDHTGYLPRLARLGFDGPIYATRGTVELCGIVLPDSGHLQEEEAAFANRKGYSKHQPAEPLYTSADALAVLEQFETVPYDAPVPVAAGAFEVTWRRAGHILGSASLTVDVRGHDLTVAFSGDLGRRVHPLLVPPAPIGRADVVVVESTYGDEDHARLEPEDLLAEVVGDAAGCGGVVVIPAFAVDRTEVVLWHLDRLVAAGRVPSIPIFVDSPMACRALDVYRSEAARGSTEVRPELHGSRLFGSLELTEVRSVDESKALNARSGPMVIISASGMATGGRVIHHLAHRLRDQRNTVLLVGFQAPGTRGDSLRQGASHLKMFGRLHEVRARVASIDLSAHADRTGLADWVATASPAPRAVFVNHGERDAAGALVDLLAERLDGPVRAPEAGERIALEPADHERSSR